MKAKWEIVNENVNRLKVFGGWIVQIGWAVNNNKNILMRLITYKMLGHCVFIPDPDHEWKIEE